MHGLSTDRAELARQAAERIADAEGAVSAADGRRCPRCAGPMPARPGATSRADDATEVCPRCGTEEALRDVLGLRRVPPHEWPVDTADGLG